MFKNSPTAYLFKVLGLSKNKLHHYKTIVTNRLWFLSDPIFLIKILTSIKRTVGNDSFFFLFIFKNFYLQKRLGNLEFRSQITKNIAFDGLEHLTAARQSGRPILIVSWNHPSHLIHDSLIDLHPDFLNITSHDFKKPNMLLAKPGDRYFAYRVYRLLKQNKFITILFDGGHGGLSFKTKLFGIDIFLSKTYPFLVKQCRPIVLPFFMVVNLNGSIKYIYNKPLFSDSEFDGLTDDVIIQKTIDHFTNNLIKHDSSQVDVKWFFERLRSKQ